MQPATIAEAVTVEKFPAVLARGGKIVTIAAMKFGLAILVYLLMAAVLGAGILLLIAGKPWLFIVALIVFVFAFGKIGCMTH